jgi:putative acetyltransferase
MSVTIAVERPELLDVAALVTLSDEYMASLYPPEGNLAVDIKALCRPDIDFVVVRLSGNAVGCGGIKWLEDGTAEIKRISVRDDARGHGLGRRIMATLEELAATRPVDRLYLETGPRNTEAVGLYRALGYRTCRPFADYEDNPHSLFMTKDLQRA